MPHKGATQRRVKFSTPSRMIEGILVVEIEVDPDKVVMVGRLKSVTPTNGWRTGTVQESLAEQGVITPDQPIVTTRSNAGTVENTTTMKRSGRKLGFNWPTAHELRIELGLQQS